MPGSELGHNPWKTIHLSTFNKRRHYESEHTEVMQVGRDVVLRITTTMKSGRRMPIVRTQLLLLPSKRLEPKEGGYVKIIEN